VSEVKLAIIGLAFLGACLGYWLATVAWRRRDVPGAVSYGWLVFLLASWAMSQVAFILSPNADVAYAVLKFGSLFGIPIPVVWLTWVSRYTGYDDWLSSRLYRLLWLEAGAYLLLVLTDPVHGQWTTTVAIETVNGLTMPTIEVGGLYMFQWAVSLILSLAGYALLVGYYRRSRSIFRKQASVIILASVIPLVGNLVFAAGFSPHPGLDPMALLLVFQGVFIGLALFRYDFLKLAPLAGDLLVDELPDPVLVLDRGDRLVDYNEPAARLFPDDAGDVIGRSARTALPGLLESLEAGTRYEPTNRSDDHADRVYDPQATPILDQIDVRRGRIVLLRDVTVAEWRLQTLEELQEVTHSFITAERPDDVARNLVEAVERVLDHPYAAVLETDEDDGLTTIAVSDDVASRISGETVTIGPESASAVVDLDEPVMFEDVDGTTVLGPESGLEQVLLIPLDNDRFLAIGSHTGGRQFTADDRRFARTLANAAETAIDRTVREAEVRENQRLLERRNQQIEFFNGILRHDVLNGIMIIQGNAELLEDHVDEDGQSRLETVQEWADDVATLTKKIRSIVQAIADEENAEADVEAVDLSGTLRRTGRKLADTYDHVAVDVEVEEGLRVQANDLLGQVFENVLLNAVEHNDADTARIRVWTSGTGDRVEVHVADNGPGIPDDRKETVFDPDFTSDASDTYGYGLYFVRTMVEVWGGSVHFVDSEEGGAEAVFEFRRADAY